MNLKLIASLPGKSLENKFNMCTDGRGGWTLSQLNVDRCITDFEDYYLVFCLGVLVQNANEQDYVEQTRLTARMNGVEIGTNVRDWKCPNSMWTFFERDAIFEWAQAIELAPTQSGMIEIEIDTKLHSEENWSSVDGKAYCRIQKLEAGSPLPRRWESPFLFSLREFLPKRWRRRNAWSTTKTGAG